MLENDDGHPLAPASNVVTIAAGCVTFVYNLCWTIFQYSIRANTMRHKKPQLQMPLPILSIKSAVFALILGVSLGFSLRLAGQTPSTSVITHEQTARLTILDDNSVARPDVKAVWGFACLVEARGHTVLFDTGADPTVFKDNLVELKVNPARIEAVVISHYHGDHTLGAPGLGSLPGVPCFTPRSFESYTEESAALRSAGLTLVPVSRTTNLFAGITVSEPMHFGSRISVGGSGQGFTNEFWEQCLAVDTPDGLVVIVGCSHPGILPMLEQVKRQTGRPLYLVIGGFHLLRKTEAEARQIATAMQALGVERVSAVHCTGEAARHAFRDVFGDRYVSAGVGAVITLPLPGH